MKKLKYNFKANLTRDDVNSSCFCSLSPLIFKDIKDRVFIVTHGYPDGSIKFKEEIQNYISSSPSKKIFVMCCHPGIVRKNNPDLEEYIFGYWDCETTVNFKYYSKYTKFSVWADYSNP